MKLIRYVNARLKSTALVTLLSQYLSVNKGMSGLTKSLLTLTREQRHLGMRVIISTQGTSYKLIG
jgi:hypothetical protein